MFTRLVTVLLFGLSQTATICAQQIVAAQPAYTEGEAILVDKIAGAWQVDVFGPDTITFERAGDNFYHLHIASEGSSPQFEAVLTNIGEDTVMNLHPVKQGPFAGRYQANNLIKVNSIFRVSLLNDTLRLSEFDYVWFYHHVISNEQYEGKYTWAGGKLLLTGTTHELRAFISSYIRKEGFFRQSLTLSRIVDETFRDGRPRMTSEDAGKKVRRPAAPVACEPDFGIQDGWFGGDGNVSVALDSNRVLWIFSDSFVGNATGTRAGSKMVANSIALMECTPDGGVSMSYYWRNQGTYHPEPFFHSGTPRYKFWPTDAFMVGDVLYVVMLKVEPKMGAAPDDVFAFRHAGLTLARIANPATTAPEKWDIQLFPWNVITDAHDWAWCYVQGRYVFFPQKVAGRGYGISRLPVAHLERPAGKIEYLKEDGNWETDVLVRERKVAFTGNGGNTVSYYEEAKKWVMVSGPGFSSSEIKVRTAPEITGPWSTPMVVYHCPEQTAGTDLYSTDKFCYLARAHVEFYRQEGRMLLITYDCNTTSYPELISNANLYVPRTIRVPIPE